MVARHAVASIVLAALLEVAAAPLSAQASARSNGQITARWESIRAPHMVHAVRIESRWRAAGEAYFRVDGQADVAAYSLSLAAPISRTSLLGAVDADTSAIPYRGQITALVQGSAAEANRGRLTDARAAAFQIAIWHYTDGLRIDRAQVPDRALRSVADALVIEAQNDSDCGGSQCASPLSTAATAATLSVRVGKTVDDALLRIAIVTPVVRRFFAKPQYVELRINGLGATVCPAEIDRVRVDLPITHNVLKSSCRFRAHDPGQKNDPRHAGLPRLIVQRVSAAPTPSIANNVITVLIPRQDRSQLVQVSWPFGNDPGMIFMPDGPTAPIMTASTFEDSRNATVSIDPDDFSSFQVVIQQSVLPFFTSHGGWGLVLLGLLLVLLFVLKDWITGLTQWLGRVVRTGWKRGRSWSKKKRAQAKARRVQTPQGPRAS